jgi:hypothetical protein
MRIVSRKEAIREIRRMEISQTEQEFLKGTPMKGNGIS